MHVFKKILYNTYSRIVIFLFIRGIYLPGFKNIKKQMNLALYQKIERQKLIRDMKGECFRLRIGPIWFRSFIDKSLLYFQKNQFLILIFFKVGISLVCIAIPVYLFILLRGILPVPERVPYEVPITKLNKTSDLHVDFPYTEGFSSGTQPPNLINYGVGFFPVKWTVQRGFFVSNVKDLYVNRVPFSNSHNNFKESLNKTEKNQSNPDNILRIGYYLFPIQNSKPISCVLQIFNSNNELLAQTTDVTPKVESYSKYSIRNSWRKAFTPNVIPAYGHIGELKIPINFPPNEIIIKSFNPAPFDSNLESQCTFYVSDFSFEHRLEKPLPRRGVIFIVADSLKANVAYNKYLMPKVNRYFKKDGLVFLEHRAQSNATVLSMSSLFTSQYPYDALTNDPKMDMLPLSIQNLGYRFGAIGAVSNFTDAILSGREIGIHNAIIAEHSRYEGRHITELAGQWLEKYGKAPFFLYLHYNTMDTPYKPPFSNLVVSRLIQNPFGLNQKKQLYYGVARYLDTELDMLFQKLKDLGIFEEVDVIFTADHGVQIDKKDWDYLSGVKKGMKGAYASKEHTVFDEEIRVPLMMKIAGNHFPKNTEISAPSAHLDLFPTLYSFMGGQNKTSLRGLNFSAPLLSQEKIATFNEIFSKRNYLLIEAQKYKGIMAWNMNHISEPTKYIRQFAPDSVTLYLTLAPWQKEITWNQDELYSKINFETHKENWVKSLSNIELQTMRKLYSEKMQEKSNEIKTEVPAEPITRQ